MTTLAEAIEAKLRELGYTDPEDTSATDSIANDARAIAAALAAANRADVEVVRAFLRTVQELEPDEVTAALSRLAGET